VLAGPLLVGAALAPADVALDAAVTVNAVVPARIRRRPDTGHTRSKAHPAALTPLG